MRIAGFVALVFLIVIGILTFHIAFSYSFVQLKLFEGRTEEFLRRYNVSSQWMEWYHENVEEPVFKVFFELIVLCLLALVVSLAVLVFEAMVVRG